MIAKALFSSETTEWGTPLPLYTRFDNEFSFNLDAAASHENYLCKNYYTTDGLYKEFCCRDCIPNWISTDNGLTGSWTGRVWCNPPYGRGVTGLWVKKAIDERKNYDVCAMLLPARTDTKWFHDYIYGKHEVRFLKGRIKFVGAKHPAPFPSMIVVFKGDK